MEIADFEKKLVNGIDCVVKKIISEKTILKISAKSRAGAEISDYLEEKFITFTKNHSNISNTQSSPKGSTKNPWDTKCEFQDSNISEEVWIDFKALKISSADSNPDIGTPNKVVKFILEGSFYILFVLVYYVEHQDGIEFKEHNGSLTKTYLLKDVNKTVRRNPKNQLQVNINAEPEYRTREEFIELLVEKLQESHKRQIEISKRALNEIKNLKDNMLLKNKESEKKYL